jgi:HK97 family phage major capsid protein
MSSVKKSGTELVLDEIKGLGGRISKQEDIITGLLKAVETPASRAGLSPEAFIARMTDGGKASGAFGADGSFAPAAGIHLGKGCGMGSYLAAVYDVEKNGPNASAESHKALKGYGVTKAALSETSGSTGGYTVPPQFSQQVMTLDIEDEVVYPRATKMPMTTATLTIPSLDITTAPSAGNSAYLGGVVASWVADAQTRPESEPQFRQTELRAHELSFYSVASNTLLADSAAGLDGLLTRIFSMARAFHRDYAYLQGNGVGKPLGILNAPATIAVTRTTSAKFQFPDVANMLSQLYWGSWRSSTTAWVIHQSVLPQLITLNDGATSAGVGRPIWIPLSAGVQDSVASPAGPQSFGSLMGLPVIVTEKLPALGTSGCVLLADFSKYLIGDRQDVQIEVSPHVKFLQNSTVWRVVCRTDGQPWLNNPITLADGTKTVSPFIYLTQ